MPLLYTIGKLTVAPTLRLAFRPTVEGLEHVPATGGAVFAGNHLSVADELFLGTVVPRHLAFWAKSEYFKGTGVKGAISKFVLTGLGAIPVERAGGRAALSAFDAAIPALKGGDLVVVYPEGTRSPDGKLYRGRTGAARLALSAGVPVIPVGMIGTDKAQPIGTRVPRPGSAKITVRFGKPLDFTGRPDDRTSLRQMTDEIMSEIQKLTGQEYVPATPRPAPTPTRPGTPDAASDRHRSGAVGNHDLGAQGVQQGRAVRDGEPGEDAGGDAAVVDRGADHHVATAGLAHRALLVPTPYAGVHRLGCLQRVALAEPVDLRLGVLLRRQPEARAAEDRHPLAVRGGVDAGEGVLGQPVRLADLPFQLSGGLRAAVVLPQPEVGHLLGQCRAGRVLGRDRQPVVGRAAAAAGQGE
ncbi:hypothetical protein GCM10027614_32370 [Micromonospora vulcania]